MRSCWRTGGIGADVLMMCASRPGKALLDQALDWIRLHGKIIIVGDETMELDRGLMFTLDQAEEA